MKTKGDLLKAAVAIGVSQGTLYAWKKLKEYPAGTLAEQLEFVRCKKLGRAALAPSTPSPKSRRGKSSEASNTEARIDWSLEDKKWAATLKKQKVESERLKIIQSAREVLLAVVAEVLTGVQKDLAAEVKDNPILARRVNAIYAKALKKLGSIPQS